jgi:catechol 2,3-dioxygenase-like lactoylglutathione lyase family enzyme
MQKVSRLPINLHTYIAVTDIELDIEFFCEVLGLRLRRRLDEDLAEFDGVLHRSLYWFGRGPGINKTIHLCFFTDHLECTARQASEAGATLVREFQEGV